MQMTLFLIILSVLLHKITFLWIDIKFAGNGNIQIFVYRKSLRVK